MKRYVFFSCTLKYNYSFQFEYRSQIEALKLKKKEERELKEAGNKRAKEIAEQNYRVSYVTILFNAYKIEEEEE